MLERVDVDLVLGLGHGGRHGARADLEQIGATGEHLVLGHPDEMALELIGDRRRGGGSCDDIAPGDVDLIGERDGDRLPGTGFSQIAVGGDDALDRGLAARGHHADGVAGTDRAADDLAGEAAEVEVGAVHPLHGHAERLVLQLVVDLDGLEVADERGTGVPGRVRRGLDHVVAAQCRERDAHDLVETDLGGELAIVGLDTVEDLLRVVDEVELVDGHDHVADAEQRHQVAVSAGLGEHTVAGIDEDDRRIGGGCPGDHVARVLLVPGGVGHDELAVLGGEEAVRDIDGDALLTFCGEAVDEEREVEFATLCADLLGIGLERGEMVLEHELRVVEQATDERGLAVVDRAAGDEAQHRLVFVLGEIGLDVVSQEIVRDVCHQK